MIRKLDTKKLTIGTLSSKRRQKEVLGWREWASLPTLGIPKIKVKVDTGAKTSCLHAFDVVVHKIGQREFISFKVHPLQRNKRKIVECECELKEWRQVTDSGGKRTLRPVIETILRIGAILVVAEVTLISRDEMGFRMLIGRQAINGQWVVDPSLSFASTRKKKLKKNPKSESKNLRSLTK